MSDRDVVRDHDVKLTLEGNTCRNSQECFSGQLGIFKRKSVFLSIITFSKSELFQVKKGCVEDDL